MRNATEGRSLRNPESENDTPKGFPSSSFPSFGNNQKSIFITISHNAQLARHYALPHGENKPTFFRVNFPLYLWERGVGGEGERQQQEEKS